jgi:fatty-acyl-CoA synthase
MFDGDLLKERARITPDRTALVALATGERITYGELDARTDRAAETLRATLQPGQRFGILAYNCVEIIELFFAAGRAGAIVVPLSTRATAHELEHIARDCDMRVVFCGEEFASICGELPIASCELRVASPSSSDRREPLSNSQHATRNPTRNPETTYCLLYTSGTTGKPKGVMIPQRQLWWNGYNTALNWGLRDDDVSPVFTPLYHAGGLAAFLIPIFSVGGTIVLHKSFDVTEIWRTIESERCTVVLGVPTIWKLLMDAPEFATADLSHVRWLISGGAPLPRFIIDAYQQRGVAFKQGYGMTEVGVNCFTMTVEDSFRKPGSIGKPMMFTEVELREMDGDPANEIGEMYIRGPHVSLGYWNNDEATRDAYGPDGFFRTGDLARRDSDGFFYIAGRRKEMFISGGVNVYPAEIERELVAHPSVSDAAVVAVPDPKWGEVGVAFVAVDVTAGDVTAGELGDYLAARIAKYKVPRRFIFIEALPRTAYGKVVKAELLAMLDSKSE